MQADNERVRAFYERNPYPPPFKSLDEHRDLYRNADRRRALFRLFWPAEPLREDMDILVAGCGTSQAARYALREPRAHVVGIDIGETSLRFTRDLKRKYALDNLELRQLPIERVAELGATFDLIVCTGVLHHLPDPELGLSALRSVLRPQGAMQLMLYAPYGRAGIYLMQEYCRVLGVADTDQELRELAATLGELPRDHPIAGVMRGARDFTHPDALADALLNPLDRAYSVPQIHELLERAGMTFARWHHQAPYLPQCGMIAKTPHAARLALLPAPLQHTAVELFRGTMVRHNLIAYRNDRARVSQPIRFTDESWRGYVPIAMPSTLCVRERLPPGCVGVLLNRAHPFPDLILTVDAFEDRLFTAINGQLTLEQIVEATTDGSVRARELALRFFERLWQYDQVVFDAVKSACAGDAARIPDAAADGAMKRFL